MDNQQTKKLLAQQEVADIAINILLVDDDPLVLLALKTALQQEKWKIVTTTEGEEAIKLLHSQQFALIICDQAMPGIAGVEVLKQAGALQPDAQRIVLTGLNDADTLLQLINVGQISQYIPKPWDHAILLQTVAASIDKYKLKQENQRLQELALLQHAELVRTYENLKEELDLGAKIHQVLLMGHPPAQHPFFEIAAKSIPSEDIDGDFFDFFNQSERVFDIVLGDVMGKGLPAALVGAAVKTQLTRFATPLERVKSFDKKSLWHEDLLTPAEIIQNVQQEMGLQLIELNHFVSLTFGRFDLQRRTFSFVDCGSTKPLYYQAKKKMIRMLQGSNFPLGMVLKDAYENFNLTYEKDDFFVFYSDGITEARSPKGEMFGVDRLCQIIYGHAELPPHELLKVIERTIRAYTKSDAFEDDCTIVIIKISEKEGCFPEEQMMAAKFASDLSQAKAVREFIREVCANVPGDIEVITSQLQLAINEIFCNSVIHGYKGQNDNEIVIEAKFTPDYLFIDIADKGEPFEPSQVQHPNMAGDKPGGFGFFIVKELVDSITYRKKRTADGWNHFLIKKQYITQESKMDISYSTHEDIITITLEGEHLDAKEAPEFKQKTLDLISSTNKHRVILDLHKLSFIDSSGLGAFLSIMRALNSRGGDLKMANMTKPIRAVFELVCMHKIFEIYSSSEEALKSFK